MAILPQFNFEIQVIAAFVIFVLGTSGFLVLL